MIQRTANTFITLMSSVFFKCVIATQCINHGLQTRDLKFGIGVQAFKGRLKYLLRVLELIALLFCSVPVCFLCDF